MISTRVGGEPSLTATDVSTDPTSPLEHLEAIAPEELGPRPT
jgi:hypothetical protein